MIGRLLHAIADLLEWRRDLRRTLERIRAHPDYCASCDDVVRAGEIHHSTCALNPTCDA